MTTVENALLKQMQKLVATVTAMQGAAGKDRDAQAAVSFQEMLQKSGSRAAESPAGDREPKAGDSRSPDEAGTQSVDRPKNADEEELKPENLAANPNAVAADLFRPEIAEDAAPAEVVLDPIPQEAVEEPAMDLSGQTAELETTVEPGVDAEVPMDRQPQDFRQAMEDAPRQETEDVQPGEVRQEAPQRQEPDRGGRPGREIEVRAEGKRRDGGEEPTGETAAPEQPVFHETRAVPVKVGERYETLDTREPDMAGQLADSIRAAAQSGQERIELRLAPQNLGSLVIEMTKDTNGVLQVVLHASTPRAEGLLNQHLSSLHTALQGYGHQEVRLEVQRGEQSERQDFRQADPDGRGQRHGRHQQERHDDRTPGEEFMQKLRLGLLGMTEQ